MGEIEAGTKVSQCKKCGKSFEYEAAGNDFALNLDRFKPTVCDGCAKHHPTRSDPVEDKVDRLREMYRSRRNREIPEFYLDGYLDGSIPPILEDLVYSLDNADRQGAYVWGGPGTGKTTRLCRTIDRALELQIVENENGAFTAKYTTELWLKHELKALFGDDSRAPEDALDTYLEADLLCIDEIGKANHTAWTLETLFMLVNQRQMSSKTTVFASNYALSNLRDGDGQSDLTGSAEYGIDLTSKMWEICGRGDRIIELTENHRMNGGK